VIVHLTKSYLVEMQRLLIIGLGSIGERHLRCAVQMGRAEVLACEVNNELRQIVTARYGIREDYESLEAAMAARPTAAVVCVPAQLHVATATRLAQAGIHLLIEKPLSTSLNGVDNHFITQLDNFLDAIEKCSRCCVRYQNEFRLCV
jgi:predicted dehydrogenase